MTLIDQPGLFEIDDASGVGATFSDCGTYRYTLMRVWDATLPVVVFLLLNPSTADALSNDPTVERCQRRARKLGFGGMVVVNLFAYRSTNPEGLYRAEDPVGPDNDRAILHAVASAGMVICGWGRHGQHAGRGKAVECLLRNAGIKLHYLQLNADGSPGHPLYLPYGLRPQEWVR